MRPQAHQTVRVPAYAITLLLMLLSAIVAVAVIWFALALLFSMGGYLQSAP